MPFGKRKYAPKRRCKRAFKKRRFTRRRRFVKRRLPLTGLPKTFKARLRYCQQVILDAPAPLLGTTNGTYVYVFRANSIYDPDVTATPGTGTQHQPHGTDQLFAWFNHCTVIGAKCKMTPVPTSVTNVSPGYYGIMVSDDGNTIATKGNIESILEDRDVVTRRPQIAGFTWDAMSSNSTRVAKFSAKRFFGKRAIVGDSLYRHNDATNPTEQAFFECYHASVDGNNPGAISVLIELEYICVFTEPRTLPQS